MWCEGHDIKVRRSVVTGRIGANDNEAARERRGRARRYVKVRRGQTRELRSGKTNLIEP